ncbi:MAG: hypothetical protein NT062_12910 [Proteobacteria bacterium]|nr:hypothetical protein [Pseudomonadota bacterium]
MTSNGAWVACPVAPPRSSASRCCTPASASQRPSGDGASEVTCSDVTIWLGAAPAASGSCHSAWVSSTQ